MKSYVSRQVIHTLHYEGVDSHEYKEGGCDRELDSYFEVGQFCVHQSADIDSEVGISLRTYVAGEGGVKNIQQSKCPTNINCE